MDKYLKMADVFGGVVNVSDVYGHILYTGCINDYSSITEIASAFDNESATYISHAINSHDELVEINKYLLSKLEEIDECFEAAYIDGLSDAFANEDIYTIKDIYCRRIEFARGVAVSAICKGNK